MAEKRSRTTATYGSDQQQPQGWRRWCVIRRRAVLILLGRIKRDALHLQLRPKPLHLCLNPAHSAGLTGLMPP
ncbi:hypothetical protein JCGZ_08844 [Jatropha curcas]|uniref:Uncharacterized protein n=1 Tax=Jatropha curcas TaxID=180498 RepID=A0A067J935_JATCU|nr:hypothetical protein JCGZ_08844 [Jatropha curcas]